jgi:copper ion binding protein
MNRIVMLVAVVLLFVGIVAAENTVKISVAGMKCNECVSKVEKALKSVEGVKAVSVSLKKKSAQVTLADGSKVTSEQLAAIIADAGFKATIGDVTVEAKKMDKEECAEKGDCCKEGKTMNKSMKKVKTENK